MRLGSFFSLHSLRQSRDRNSGLLLPTRRILTHRGSSLGNLHYFHRVWCLFARRGPVLSSVRVGCILGIHSRVSHTVWIHAFALCLQRRPFLTVQSSWIHYRWFYPTENLFFSLCLPPGQEAELTGFFVYCTQILVWLPPLLFSILIEAGVSQQVGLISLVVFFIIAFGFLSLVAPWDEVILESMKNHQVAVVEPEA